MAYLSKNADRSAWELAIRRLYSRGWTDARIADALSSLTRAEIARIEANSQWNKEHVEGGLHRRGEREWTPRQVTYTRRRLGLAGRKHRPECGSLVEARWIKIRTRLSVAGWGNLINRHEDLSASEMLVIEALASRPMSRAELEIATGVDLVRKRTGRETPLQKLMSRSIVVQSGDYHHRIYRLAASVLRHDWPRPERLESNTHRPILKI